MQQGPVIIRKYPNRRLYDTSARRYVNLEELAAMIRQGVDLQVVDAKSGEDLTRVVLTQIIVDDAREQPSGLPLELLRQLIMTSDRAGREFIMWYLKSAFDAYHKVQEAVETRFDDVRSAALSPINVMKNFLTPPRQEPSSAEMEALHRRIAELEARLETRTARKPPGRRKR